MKISRYLFPVICSIILVDGIFAQQQVDAIYLKDGSKIIGSIIEQKPNISIKVQMKDGSELVFSFDKIERIVKENNPTIPADIADKSYPELGINMGTPAGLNIAVGHWFGTWGLRVSGMSYSSNRQGFQANLERKLSDNINRSHSLTILLGRSIIKTKEWNYYGVTYQLNWNGFFLESGFSVGHGSYSSPQFLLQIGYMYRFLP